MPLLAEIGDKMPTVTCWMTAACIVALIALGFGLLRRWLVLLPLPLIAFFDWGMWSELQEPGFGQAIISELGWEYVICCFAGWNLPFLAVVAIVMLRPRRFNKPGHCTHCGYLLRGLPEPRCPECGTPFADVAATRCPERIAR